MTVRKGIMGGFVAINEVKGQIENCYSLTSFNGRKALSGGFVGKNAGVIQRCYCGTTGKNLNGAFCGEIRDARGTLVAGGLDAKSLSLQEKYAQNLLDRRCYVLNKSGRKSSIEKLWDGTCLTSYKKLDSYDKKVWSAGSRKQPLYFREENWQLKNVTAKADPKKLLVIKSVRELYAFADKINNGSIAYLSCWVRLDADLDLKGKEWTPIGYNRNNMFAGVFDGNGHSITNFYVKNETYTVKGLFGYLRGQVLNLSVDCIIKGDGKMGAIAAVNEGIIAYCGATTRFVGSGGDLCAGGLVGINAGKILKSYAAGQMAFQLFPTWPIPIVASAAILAGVTLAYLIPAIEQSHKTYQPIAKEGRQKKIESNENLQETEATEIAEGGSRISFSFKHNVDINSADGLCTMNFSNPSTDTNNLVVELYLKTDSGDVLIATSGAISPGYQVDAISLNEAAYDVLWTGEDIEGYVKLYPYDVETNDKSMVETQLPVTMNVY